MRRLCRAEILVVLEIKFAAKIKIALKTVAFLRGQCYNDKN